ncbi:MAG: cytochrome c3 family protein, partial [Planctomycetota bacterium]|nr:cytochrome c3 family protein [Planctomycetota bacterium]
RGKLWVGAWALMAVLVVGGLVWRNWYLDVRQETIPPVALDPLPVIGPRGDFVGSSACRECHQKNHSSWHQTFHRTMTQKASSETVLAPFDGVTLESRGRRYELSQAGDRFAVSLVDPDWESRQIRDEIDDSIIDRESEQHRVTRPVVMTTGSHHMQGFWIPGGRGNLLRQIPWYYHLAEKRWIPREDAFLEPPGSPRHFMVWNDNCLSCHSTGGTPGMNQKTQAVQTAVAELGVSCEACHGAGREHVARHAAAGPTASAQRVVATDVGDPTIINPARLDHRGASRVCGQCHSTFVPPDQDKFLANGYKYRPGDELSTAYNLVRFDSQLHTQMERRGTPVYWLDGTCWVGGREYLGLVDSKCFTKGQASCLSCHSMHDAPPEDQLAAKMDGDRACVQCHKEYTGSRLIEHTHHSSGSTGSRCYNCHMPHTSYALLGAIRSHRVDSPRVGTIRGGGRPNACNLCHLDRSSRWASERLVEWYGHKPADLVEIEETVSNWVLLVLQGDPIQRVLATWHAGWQPARDASGSDWLVPHLADQLDDAYSVNRWAAWQALKSDPRYRELEFDYVGTRSSREAVWTRVRREWAAESSGLDPDLARRTVVIPGEGLDRKRTEKLLLERDYREVMVPE